MPVNVRLPLPIESLLHLRPVPATLPMVSATPLLEFECTGRGQGQGQNLP